MSYILLVLSNILASIGNFCQNINNCKNRSTNNSIDEMASYKKIPSNCSEQRLSQKQKRLWSDGIHQKKQVNKQKKSRNKFTKKDGSIWLVVIKIEKSKQNGVRKQLNKFMGTKPKGNLQKRHGVDFFCEGGYECSKSHRPDWFTLCKRAFAKKRSQTLRKVWRNRPLNPFSQQENKTQNWHGEAQTGHMFTPQEFVCCYLSCLSKNIYTVRKSPFDHRYVRLLQCYKSHDTNNKNT